MSRHQNAEKVVAVNGNVAGQASTTFTHPAFGLIQKNVYTGKCNLFGSSFEMDEVYAITIKTASHLCTSFSENYNPDENVVKILLSKQQWVDFVTTSNSGVGTPCTLKYMRTGEMKEVPDFDDIRYNSKDYYQQVKDKANAATSRLTQLNSELMAEINGKASKTRLREIQRQIDIEVQNLPSNLAFTVQVAEEAMNDVAHEITIAAKSKIENYAQVHGIDNAKIESVGFNAITFSQHKED